ncbi:MAG TPA: ATP-dependent DNA helicase RecQ [Chitinophagaceae bacterium]
MQQPEAILKQYWGHQSFRGQQENIIRAVLEKKDTLALLPTGGGKSVCFQLPALMMDGLCLVVSPLIALMKDQVENLQKRNIAAAAVHSGLGFFEVRKELQRAADGEYKFLYVSPERIQTRLFREFLPAFNVCLLAVDEAHCISQWGYDFRPPYLKIAELRNMLPGVPVLALTASATPQVQQDIVNKLCFGTHSFFRQSFSRPNLSYSCLQVESRFNKLLDILKNVAGSSLVYCRNRKQTQDIARLLTMQGYPAEYYHAGLSQEERNRRQELWIQGKTRIIVCTNAFGMGIDKPDVRSVIHYNIPDCIESYYQEAGRAGRDGNRSYAVALYQQEDLEELSALPELRFPPIASIKKVYQSVADYLGIPVGIGEGNYYDFDLADFSSKFQYDIHLVINALKMLEQEGHLAFNESIFLPPQVKFTAPRTLLEDFEAAHPDLEPMVKCLLRTYEGIYDNRISVNEKQLAKLIRISVDEVRQQLMKLRAFAVIEYLPQKETPQLCFLLNRAPAQYLSVDNQAYLKRKKQYAARVASMLRYLQQNGCRSRYIAEYFGEEQPEQCGTCDNCLRGKRSGFTGSEFRNIEQRIRAVITEDGITVPDLVASLHDVQKEKLWKVLDFLQAEQALTVRNNLVLLHKQPGIHGKG